MVVGVQCLSCAAKKPKAGLRASLGSPIWNRTPLATLGLIVVCAAVFLLQVAAPVTLWLRDRCLFRLPSFSEPSLADQFSYWPECSVLGPSRFVLSAFFHTGVLHLVVTMVALWVAGSFLEQILGRWRVVAVFLLSAIGASVAADLQPGSYWAAGQVGASAGVFGLFGALAWVVWHSDERIFGVKMSGVGVVFTLFAIASVALHRITVPGHVGGLVIGLVLGWIFADGPVRRGTRISAIGTAGVLALFIVVCLWYHGVTPTEWWGAAFHGRCVERAEVWTCYG